MIFFISVVTTTLLSRKICVGQYQVVASRAPGTIPNHCTSAVLWQLETSEGTVAEARDIR